MLPDLLVPPPPSPGSSVAIVSPSAPAVARWPHRVEAGVKALEALGFSVRIMPNASKATGWTAGSPEERARDINEAFADPEISVILAATGGNHSAQLLAHLDYEAITSNPKVFQGYSDITTLHWALMKNAGLQTFYGPALVSELGEHPVPLPYTLDWMQKAWAGGPLDFTPATEWTDEFLDWNERLDLERPRKMQPSAGWVLVREGVASGPLLGGCLETLMWHVRDTDIWMDPEGAILFLETSEETPSPGHVDAYLTTLERTGVFDSIDGLVFGRAYGYDEATNQQLFAVLAERTSASGIPVLANFDCGHADPMVTLPLGRTARLDAASKSLSIL
ncbi:MAG: muramoyltetrapeptide carboxypeptidase [Actinomycetota bacterium]|jgi:muramoyltetrapeptide carboxypeptidase|nr:muramoyltetrapeptide carboxypeptidase [Actinomycetota bacterium]